MDLFAFMSRIKIFSNVHQKSRDVKLVCNRISLQSKIFQNNLSTSQLQIFRVLKKTASYFMYILKKLEGEMQMLFVRDEEQLFLCLCVW